MLSSAPVTRQTSWLLPSKSPQKTEWPDPELSLGRPCCTFGRNRCWEVIGPAQALLDSIFPKIKNLLESRSEYLNEKEPIPVAIIFGLYMIGRSEKKSNPTLLFTCVRKAPRRKALNIVLESGILSPYPGVLLGESARSPLSHQPAVLLASDQDMLDEWRNAFNIYLAPSKSPLDILRGISIDISIQHEGSIYCKNATIGGLVYSENEDLTHTYYAITVAHVFAQKIMDNQVLQNDYTSEDDIEFAFYGHGNDYEENDDEFVEMSSRGSVSPELKQSLHNPTPLTDGIYQESLFQVPPTALSGNSIGTLYASSENGAVPSLDWAMIELNPESVQTLKKLTLVNPSRIITKNMEDREVYTYSGSSGKLLGIMSSNQTLLKLPGTQMFQEVWVVRFASILHKGDCGSWVVDRISGDLYGHLVAGHLEAGLGYIVPAWQIFEDMQKQIEKTLKFVEENRKQQTAVQEYSELNLYHHNWPGAASTHQLPHFYGFIPTHTAVHHKRSQHQYEEMERMYKCEWNGCEKAYGTLNHLNAHTVMQSHGEKHTEEEFAEIRLEWELRKEKEAVRFKEIDLEQQYPPCDTLRIRNVIGDTFNDELETLFSEQPGYELLGFTTGEKDGPGHLVKFEDVASATGTLHKLHGHVLQNSNEVIHLSFAENSLSASPQLERNTRSASPTASRFITGSTPPLRAPIPFDLSSPYESEAQPRFSAPSGHRGPSALGPNDTQYKAFMSQERFNSSPAYMFGK